MRLNKRRFTVAAFLALSLLVLAACGGGGDEQSSGSGGSEGGGGGGEIVIELGPGFVFNPAEIEVTKGQEVKLVLDNVDSIEHNLELADFGINQDVAAGEQAEVTFTPDQAGEFEFVCNIPGHAEGGMTGKLIVKE